MTAKKRKVSEYELIDNFEPVCNVRTKEEIERDTTIGVRVNAVEKKAIEKWAKAQDLAASVAMRRVILTALRKDGFLK
jgi:hypothetical protein